MSDQTWREIQRKNITNVEFLCDFLQLDSNKRKKLLVKTPFPLNLPIRLADKIKKNTLDDPILLQFIPLTEETKQTPGFSLDPVQDTTFCKSEKLIQKYPGRALLVTTSACAMHCRYCFRKNFPYESSTKGFEKELFLIEQDPSLKEIILSGGDPLSLSNANLKSLLISLDNIEHLKRIRFHTRFPIGLPERIDAEFLSLLKQLKKQIYFVIHSNHHLELDKEVLFKIKQVRLLGIPTLCQSVLLKKINDNSKDLQMLCETLVDNGIIPYYLHQLDKVQGSSHFEVDQKTGLELMSDLRKQLSGYALFDYVVEVPNVSNKVSIL